MRLLRKSTAGEIVKTKRRTKGTGRRTGFPILCRHKNFQSHGRVMERMLEESEGRISCSLHIYIRPDPLLVPGEEITGLLWNCEKNTETGL